MGNSFFFLILVFFFVIAAMKRIEVSVSLCFHTVYFLPTSGIFRINIIRLIYSVTQVNVFTVERVLTY